MDVTCLGKDACLWSAELQLLLHVLDQTGESTASFSPANASCICLILRPSWCTASKVIFTSEKSEAGFECTWRFMRLSRVIGSVSEDITGYKLV